MQSDMKCLRQSQPSVKCSTGCHKPPPACDASLVRWLILASLLAATLPLMGCSMDKGTLERSRTEIVTVAARKFEVRITQIAPDEYRMLVVRATAVVRPDPEREYQRNWNVAHQLIDRTCKGSNYQVLEDHLDDVTLFTRFRCQP